MIQRFTNKHTVLLFSQGASLFFFKLGLVIALVTRISFKKSITSLKSFFMEVLNMTPVFSRPANP